VVDASAVVVVDASVADDEVRSINSADSSLGYGINVHWGGSTGGSTCARYFHNGRVRDGRRNVRSAIGICALAKSALPQASPSPSIQSDSSKPVTPDKDKDPKKPKKPKRGELVIAPIPATSPAVGTGLILVAGYVFKFKEDDKLSPPSVLGAVGAATNNGKPWWWNRRTFVF